MLFKVPGMLRRMTSFVVVFTAAVAMPVHAWAAWEWSQFSGEETRSVLGCSDTWTDDSWVCLAVRCEVQGELGLYIELTNLSVTDRMYMHAGGQTLTVEGTSERGEAPYAYRLFGDMPTIVAAFKSADDVRLDYPASPLNEGYNVIPLAGAAAALSALEQSCGIAQIPAIPPTASPVTIMSPDTLAATVAGANCSTAKGHFSDDAFNYLDVTGDWLFDLVLDHRGIICDDNGYVESCGFRACNIDFYVNNGSGFDLVYSVLSIGVSIDKDVRPIIGLTSHDFVETKSRWNGVEFAWIE